jgi:hypothetical protein
MSTTDCSNYVKVHLPEIDIPEEEEITQEYCQHGILCFDTMSETYGLVRIDAQDAFDNYHRYIPFDKDINRIFTRMRIACYREKMKTIQRIIKWKI